MFSISREWYIRTSIYCSQRNNTERSRQKVKKKNIPFYFLCMLNSLKNKAQLKTVSKGMENWGRMDEEWKGKFTRNVIDFSTFSEAVSLENGIILGKTVLIFCLSCFRVVKSIKVGYLENRIAGKGGRIRKYDDNIWWWLLLLGSYWCCVCLLGHRRE